MENSEFIFWNVRSHEIVMLLQLQVRIQIRFDPIFQNIKRRQDGHRPPFFQGADGTYEDMRAQGWSSPYLGRLVNPVPFQTGGRGRMCTPLCLSSPFFFHFCGPVFQSCLVWQSHGVPCMDRYLPHYIADTLCSSYMNQVPKSCFLKAS